MRVSPGWRVVHIMLAQFSLAGRISFQHIYTHTHNEWHFMWLSISRYNNNFKYGQPHRMCSLFNSCCAKNIHSNWVVSGRLLIFVPWLFSWGKHEMRMLLSEPKEREKKRRRKWKHCFSPPCQMRTFHRLFVPINRNWIQSITLFSHTRQKNWFNGHLLGNISMFVEIALRFLSQ